MSGKYKTWVEIDEQALRSNIRALRSLTDDKVNFCMVVKVNAYGHGVGPVVKAGLDEKVCFFAVDSIDEAIEVRKLAPTATVIVLGYVLIDRLAEVIQYDIELVVYNQETISKLQEFATSAEKKAQIHLKLETGMNRQGITEDQLPLFINLLKECPNVEVSGASTHLADLDNTTSPEHTFNQSERFSKGLKTLSNGGISPRHLHTACSAAVILYPQVHGTLVRAGISLYGFWPSAEIESAARRSDRYVELSPVLTWKTRVVQTKNVPAGQAIGYGLTEKVTVNSRIAVIPVGYADGLDRNLSSVGEVLIRDQRCKIMGRVCMNMCIIDVSKLPTLELEEEVVLIGRKGSNQILAEEIAGRLNTIQYEVVTRINPLIPRITKSL